MPKYIFTSDQRIGDLPNKIQWLANYLNSGGSLTDITDKSENNNATTLQSYYNIYAGNQLCKDSCSDPISAIRNFVLKFQFPNTRTSESYNDSLLEGTLLAPFRVVVSVLDEMANISNSNSSSISLDEVLWFIFCDPKVYTNPFHSTKALANRILTSRSSLINFETLIAQTLEWKQYNRQVRELFNVLTYASSCFELKNGIIYYSRHSLNYKQDKTYIDSIISYNLIWYPSKADDFSNSRKEFINYMDTSPNAYSVIQLNNRQLHNNKPLGIPLQQIFYGAPGTGKSHEVWKRTKNYQVFRTTFHPDSDYSTFVGAYKPVMEEVDARVIPVAITNGISMDANNGTYKEKKITYKFMMQTFTKAYLKAWQEFVSGATPSPVFLVVEEINRGNCAQIFGDLFQLLDRNDDEDREGFSTYPIESDSDLQQAIAQSFRDGEYKLPQDISCDGAVKDYVSAFGSTLSKDIQNGRVLLLPPNLFIWATMNTSDQSLFPIDSAFKRRWEWKYVPINTSKENWSIDVNGNLYSWTSFLDKVNFEIGETTSSEDKKLGFYFCKAKDNVISAEKLVSKVLFYLYNDVFKDYAFDRDFFRHKEGDSKGKLIAFQEFFDGDGGIKETNVAELLDNLSVDLAQ